MANGEVHIYDGMGGFVSKMNIQCLSNSGSANNKVVTLHWYSGKHGLVHRDAPTLAICYDNGRMQIMRDENDESKCSITKKGVQNQRLILILDCKCQLKFLLLIKKSKQGRHKV